MKKMITFILGAAMAISLVGCSGNNGSSNHGGSGDGSTSSYSSAVEVLETVYGVYSEDQKFPIGGGDSEHMTTDAPGAFDVSKTEELTSTLSLPESETTHIDDAGIYDPHDECQHLYRRGLSPDRRCECRRVSPTPSRRESWRSSGSAVCRIP